MKDKLIRFLPVLSGICWGSSGVFVRILDSSGLGNTTITFVRLLMTVSFMAIWILITDRSLFRISRKDLPLLAFSGIFGYFFMNLTYNYSITNLSMSLASILLCTAPVYVIIIGAVIFKEKITLKKIICMAAVLLGCILLSGVVDSGTLKWSLLGIAAGVGSSISNAVCTMGCNEASGVRGIRPVTVLFYNCLAALICITPFADFGQAAEYVSSGPAKALLVLSMNALVSCLLPNLMFNISFKHMDSGDVSILASGAEPTSALILGIILYSEIPTVSGLIGMIMVIGAIIVLTKAENKKTKVDYKEIINGEIDK